MQAKEYLSQVKRLNDAINYKIEELSRLRSNMTSLSSPSFSKGGRSQSYNAPFVYDVEKLTIQESWIDEQVDRLYALRQETDAVISTLDSMNEQLALKYRYLLFMEWSDIADRLNVAVSTVLQWHRRALKNIVVPEKYRNA